MDSHVLRKKEGLQFSYNLPHQVYDAYVHPRRSSNGSSVIVYAHEEGIRVVWSGGRRFKEATAEEVNGDSTDLTDSPPKKAQEYEDDEYGEEARSAQEILTYYDVVRGSACTLLAAPSLPTDCSTDEYPSILESHLVVLAACADRSLKLIVIPLEPEERLTSRPQILSISDPDSHHDLVSAVAITLTAETREEEKDSEKHRSQSRGRAKDDAIKSKTIPRQWYFLIASTSATGNGLLLTHQIPVFDDGQVSTDSEDLIPIQRQYLKTPLARCRLSFNPSACPAERHSHLLVAFPDGGGAKVYQTLPSVKQHSKRRRGSTATNESSSSNIRPVRSTSASGGRPLITLLPPFIRQGQHDLFPRRKHILDAAWIMQGRAIVILMDDGEWGIWDLEATGLSFSNNLVKGKGSVSGIQGGALTKLTTKGIIGPESTTIQKSSSNANFAANTLLTPMTPHTRKTRAQGLFRGADQSSTLPAGAVQFAKGSIEVITSSWNASRTSSLDEAVLFTYNSSNVWIPRIQAYWRSDKSSKANPEGPGARLAALPLLNIAGEEQIKAHLLPAKSVDADSQIRSSRSTPEFLVVSSTKIVLFIPNTHNTAQSSTSAIPLRFTALQPSNPDQTLLNSGELDVDGMDRILASMASNSGMASQAVSLTGPDRRNVGLDVNDDDTDMDLGTPTMPKSAKSRLTVAKGVQGGRRLFT